MLAQAGEFKESLEVAERIGDRDSYYESLSDISGALAARGQIDRALVIAHDLESKGLGTEALCRMSQALAETGHIGEAKDIICRIGDDDRRSDALACIGEVLARQGKALEALEVVERLPGEHRYRGSDMFDALIRTLTSSGRIGEAIQTSRLYTSVDRVRALADIYLAIQQDRFQEGQQKRMDQ